MATAADGPGPGNGSPPFPFAVGGGTVLTPAGFGGLEHITLSAHLGPNGPSGHYTIRFGSGELVQGDVTCMLVNGNRAAAGGPLHEPIMIGGTLLENAVVLVEDNGEGGPIPDRASGFIALPATFARVCDPTTVLTGALSAFPIESGNFVVNGG
jgi:hypothetical protein